MKTQNFALVLGLTGLAVLLQTNKASALDFSFSYTANGVTTQGILNTTTTSTSGQYLITGITNGTRGGTQTISYVSANGYGGNDNLLIPNASNPNKLDFGGFDYSANGVTYNIGKQNSNSYYEENSFTAPSGNGNGQFTFATFTVSQVPFDFNPTEGLVLGLGLSTGLGICKKKLARKSTVI